MDYKSTLNLPQTGFPMKANLNQREKEFLASWDRISIYEKIKDKTKEYPGFVLHDGPPYANGNIHLGHALNKILKDIIVKFKTMSGFRTDYIPGWDCHGLPIEHQVYKGLGPQKGGQDIGNIRKKCREYAEKYIDIQRDEFKRLGVFGDWGHPYLTMNPRYEATIIREFSKFIRSGGIYKGYKPVHWCPSCKTALAEAEVEYMDHSSPSVFVKFKIVDSTAFNDILGIDTQRENAFFVIWTTTPWTLPANLAIALHPTLEYVVVKFEEEYLIVARDLLSGVMQAIGGPGHEVVNNLIGSTLEGIKCSHPFIERTSKVILADFVTLEQGSGCVHIAPGHGQEDYDIGLKYDLNIYAPVDDCGRFTEEVEGFSGQYVFDSNRAIIETMRSNGALLHQENIVHSYPHCWRCKSPVIFRATEQWFIAMEHNDLRKRALAEIRRVEWIPKWGESRINGMIENRPDWCISRQRSWGVPLIIFYCADCKKPILNPDIIDLIASRVEKEGVDIWFSRDIKELVGHDVRCPDCGSGELTKEMDILDVWFESGVSYTALIEERGGFDWPSDLYLEGSDQHRGWFHSSLLIGVETHNNAPYKAVLTHGFVVDGDGKKMAKSVGNVIAPQSVIDKYGAEILRLWVAAEDYRDDIRISNDILTRLAEAYRRIRNTCRFMLGNLYDFDPKKDNISFNEREEIDRWILHRFQYIKEKIIKGYETYQFHVCFHTLHQFCVVDLSALYLDISKDRLYTSRAQDKIRKSAQSAIYEILMDMVKIMSPILVFTAEEVWSYLPFVCKEESVHLASFPKVTEVYQDEDLAGRWERLMSVKDEISKALEDARAKKVIGHSLDAMVRLYIADEDLFSFLSAYSEILRTVLIVSGLKIANLDISSWDVDMGKSEIFPGLGIKIEKAKGGKCDRCWQYCTSVGEHNEHPTLCKRCRVVLGV